MKEDYEVLEQVNASVKSCIMKEAYKGLQPVNAPVKVASWKRSMKCSNQ